MDETTKPLTAKQQAFCREYLLDLNAAAARRAGYSEHTAEQQGSRLLSNAKVQAEIQRAMDDRAERAEVDADYVIERLKHEAEHSGKASSHSARVSALGLLGRHLGMFTDKVETTQVVRQRLIVCVDAPTPLLEGGVEGVGAPPPE